MVEVWLIYGEYTKVSIPFNLELLKLMERYFNSDKLKKIIYLAKEWWYDRENSDRDKMLFLSVVPRRPRFYFSISEKFLVLYIPKDMSLEAFDEYLATVEQELRKRFNLPIILDRPKLQFFKEIEEYNLYIVS